MFDIRERTDEHTRELERVIERYVSDMKRLLLAEMDSAGDHIDVATTFAANVSLRALLAACQPDHGFYPNNVVENYRRTAVSVVVNAAIYMAEYTKDASTADRFFKAVISDIAFQGASAMPSIRARHGGEQ